MPLHCAICNHNTSLAHELLRKRADIHAIDKDGQTLLHLTARANNELVMRSLLWKEADVTIRDRYGYTAADIAARNSFSMLVNMLDEHSKYHQAVEKLPRLKLAKWSRQSIGLTDMAILRYD